MYNTTYLLPENIYNKFSDIEVYADIALWHYAAPVGSHNRAIYTEPLSGFLSADGFGLSAHGPWTAQLTSFSGNNSFELDPNYNPGNGFCIFFYDASDPVRVTGAQGARLYDYYGNLMTEPLDFTGGNSISPYTSYSNYYPYNNIHIDLFKYQVSYFQPGGVGESLGYKPYTGAAQLTAFLPTYTGAASASPSDSAILSADGMSNGYLAVGFDVAGGFAGTYTNSKDPDALSGHVPGQVVIASGPWNGWDDLYATPSGTTLPLSSSLYQQISTNESAVKFNTWKVALEECGTRVRVALRPEGSEKFHDFIDYIIPESTQMLLPPTSALRVGLAFSTSDKVMNCEIRSLNCYGRHTNNPLFDTDCYTSCLPVDVPADQSDFNCPGELDIDFLRTEGTFIPIVTEGYPWDVFGMNYIVEAPDNTLYYDIDLTGAGFTQPAAAGYNPATDTGSGTQTGVTGGTGGAGGTGGSSGTGGGTGY